jgi:hypothetical protein
LVHVDSCNPASTANKDTAVVIGALITFVTVVYSAFQTSSASSMNKFGLSSPDQSTALLPVTDSTESDSPV